MRSWSKQKVLGFFIGTLLFSVTILLFSYANYVWRSSDTGVSFNISDEYFYCESGLELEKQGLSPVLDYRKGDYWKFKVNNIGNSDTKFSLSLNITSIDTPLLSESFKYKLVVDKTGGSNQCNNTSSSGCEAVLNGEGNFKSMKVGMNTLVESIDLPNDTRYEYYLFLYIDGNMSNDVSMQNSVISATLDVCEIVVFLDYNGGNVQQKFLKATDTYEGLPDKPTKDSATIIYNTDGGSNVVNGVINHTFAGWFLENTYQNRIMATSPVKTTVNHTLYVKWTDDVLPLPSTTKEGHIFDGWYSDSAKTKFVGKSDDNYSTTSTSSIPLYAKWTPIQYTLTVKPNGGTWGGKTTDSTITQDYGTILAIPVPNPLAAYTIMYSGNGGTTPSPTKAYREFNGWSLGGAGKGKITTTAPIATTTQTYTYGVGNDTLSANYNATAKSTTTATSIQNYTITYDLNGTDGTSDKTTETIAYTMNGWYTAITGGTKRASNGGSYSPTGNETLYAQWTRVSTTLATITKTGYTCNWNTEKSGTGTAYQSGQENYTPIANIVLYANCQANSYTLTINPNGGTFDGKTTNSTYIQNYGTTKSISDPTPTAYYTITYNGNGVTSPAAVKAYRGFGGWSLSGAGNFSSGTYTFGAGSGTLTATYNTTANKIIPPNLSRNYTINYDVNGTGATVSTATMSVPYTMDGWYDAATGGTKITTPGADYYPTASKALYAHWTPNTTTLATITKKGYTCNWNTASDGTGISYTSGQTGYSNNGDVTLYVRCTVNKYKVTYKSGNLVVGFPDVTGATDGANVATYSVKNKVITVTAKANDGYVATNGRVYLSAGQTYYFSCDTNASTWVNSESGDTVEAYLLLDGGYSTVYYMGSNDNFSFTPEVTGIYWIRFDVNMAGKTYNFSNVKIMSTIGEVQTVVYGSTYGTTIPDSLNHDGMNFNGWYTAESGGTQITSSSIVSTASDHTIYGRWTPNSYAVTYNGNKFNTQNQTAMGLTIAYDPDTSYLTINGSNTSLGALNPALMKLENQTFVAGEQYKITLTYISGSLTGSGSSLLTSYIYKENGWELSTPNWSDTALPTSGISTSTLTVSTIGATEGKMLAIGMYYTGTFTFTNYKIKVNITKVESKNTTYGATYGSPFGGTLPIPTRYGYSFAGWYTAESGGVRITSDSIMTIDGGQTLYAHWNEASYYLDLNWNVDGAALGLGDDYGGGGRLYAGLKVGSEDIGYVSDYYKKVPHGTAWSVYGLKLDGVVMTGDFGSGIVTNATNISLALYTLDFTTNGYGTVTKSSLLVPWGGSYKASGNVMSVYGGRTVTANPTTAAGYTTTFSGWSLTEGTIKEKTTITANFSRKGDIYSVTLDNQSATTAGTTKYYYQYNTTKVVDGVTAYYYTDSALTTPLTNGNTISVPTKTGYTFGGYYTGTNGTGTQYVNASGGTINNAYQTIGNKTLYANWLANTYTVSYNGNGATAGSTDSSSHVYDVGKQLTLNGFVRNYTVSYNANGGSVSPNSHTAAYGFAGWATSSGGAVSYSNGQWVDRLTSVNGATFNLYAKWNSSSINLATPSRTGYTFNGWYNGGTNIGGSGAPYTPTSNISVSANWSANKYNVRFNSNNLVFGLEDRAWGDDSQEYRGHYSISNKVVTVTSNTTDGYVFTTARVYLMAGVTYKFSMSSNGTYGVEGDTVQAFWFLDGKYGTYYYMESKNHTFTPDVTGNYWLRLDVNQSGATHTFSYISVVGPTYLQEYTYDEFQPLTLNSFGKRFSLDYYVQGGNNGNNVHYDIWCNFSGWATSATGGVFYRDGANLSNMSSINGGIVDLYAVWDMNINFQLITVSRPGYNFLGWYTAASGGTRVGGGGEWYTMPNGPLKLYAHWG